MHNLTLALIPLTLDLKHCCFTSIPAAANHDDGCLHFRQPESSGFADAGICSGDHADFVVHLALSFGLTLAAEQMTTHGHLGPAYGSTFLPILRLLAFRA